MKNYILILFIALVGCGPTWHLKQAKRHELIAISKGAKINRDTVYKPIYIKVPISADSASEVFDPTFDLIGFQEDIGKNDSLISEINKLRNDSLGIALDKERTIGLLVKANNELTALRKRIIRGYSKDSTYVLVHDSVTQITVRVEGGVLKSVDYSRRETSIQVREVVPVEVRKIFEMGYKPWQVYLAVGGVGLLLLIIGIVIGRLTKNS